MGLPIKTILVVDDDTFMVEMISRILLKSNPHLNLIKTGDGVAALELAYHRKPDLAIVDLVMPRMDGEVLAKKLKELYPQLPVVIFTGHGTPKSKDKLLNHNGVDSYLNKSNDMPNLYSEVAKLMHHAPSSPIL